MIWRNDCRRVTQLLALDAGHDLSEQDHAETRRHVARCAPCREHLERVQASQQALEQVRSSTVAERSFQSLWPELKSEISARDMRPRRRAFGVRPFGTRLLSVLWNGGCLSTWRFLNRRAETINGWLPVGALAVACLAILVVADRASQSGHFRFSDDQFSDQTQVQHVMLPSARLPYPPQFPHLQRASDSNQGEGGGWERHTAAEPPLEDQSARDWSTRAVQERQERRGGGRRPN